ncbi:MAG: aldo/keto reductase [Bacteroidales bacterium]|nr:aldo/keto reductase [Bacteroidales bacterium]
MFYNQFKDLNISALGFGTMRLPLLEDRKTIDRELTSRMIDEAIKGGVNYFDTAAPYHSGLSEVVVGEILSRYPRESWLLADKYPGHQHYATFDPAGTFENQLRKCRVDYFDFYLYHNICENCIDDYMDPRWGILDYFVRQREEGRIRHLGMSCHGSVEFLKEILDGPYGKVIEFCQIQLNYLDWTLQDAKAKVELLNARGIPIWVMEPVRGGKLAQIEAVPVRDAFRWVSNIPGVTVTLSGMSNLEQVQDNITNFEERAPLSEEENARILEVAESLKTGVPCTACRYCCDGCPAGLDIPTLLKAYNDLSFGFNFSPMMLIESLPEDQRPSACLECGQCSSVCPQGIDVVESLAKLNALYDKYPKWSDICRERCIEEAKNK